MNHAIYAMPAQPDITLLVLPGALASGVAISLDMLRTAATLAPRLSCPAPTWRVVSPDGGAVALGNGLLCPSAPLSAPSSDDGSVWVVPGLGSEDPERLDRRLADDDTQRAVAALAAHLAHGGRVAAACASVFLLQAAGALDGRRATTTWWLAPALQRRAPACRVDADRMVCADGPIVTAGAAMAQSDLMLHLLRDRFGGALADAVGRVLLVDARAAQAPFVIPAMLANGDALVGALMKRVESALPDPPSVAALAEAFAMSPRTLARRVQAATGRSPLALIQAVRLHRARTLLESSRMTLDRIAEAVGYEDATALRRLMRRHAGAPPGRFRRTAAD
jgi:transcriptional regulator GlxA family with amidase domain